MNRKKKKLNPKTSLPMKAAMGCSGMYDNVLVSNYNQEIQTNSSSQSDFSNKGRIDSRTSRSLASPWRRLLSSRLLSKSIRTGYVLPVDEPNHLISQNMSWNCAGDLPKCQCSWQTMVLQHGQCFSLVASSSVVFGSDFQM